jgi:hypothetical protein
LLRMHADRMRRRERETTLAAGFSGAHPQVPVAHVAARPQDVHDLDGLRSIGADLASS